MGEKRASTEVEARFNAVVEKYGDFLRKTIVQVCPKDMGLNFADIEQEARVRLWRALESEREIHHLGSYIYRIAVTATISAVQRMKARREEQLRLPEEDADAGAELVADRTRSPDALAEQEELFRKVEQALGRLAENRRITVGLYLQGMTTEEIGGLFGWSEAKARNLVYRGLKDLRRELRALGIDYK